MMHQAFTPAVAPCWPFIAFGAIQLCGYGIGLWVYLRRKQ